MLTFREWMHDVDVILSNACGMSHLCLPDICYRDMYDDGCDPEEAAAAALQEAGAPAELIENVGREQRADHAADAAADKKAYDLAYGEDYEDESRYD